MPRLHMQGLAARYLVTRYIVYEEDKKPA